MEQYKGQALSWVLNSGVIELSLHRAPELLELMARQGIVLVPTLSTFHDVAERIADRFEPHLVEQAKRQKEEAYKTLLAARDAGVVIAMGFDSGPPGADTLEIVFCNVADHGEPQLSVSRERD